MKPVIGRSIRKRAFLFIPLFISISILVGFLPLTAKNVFNLKEMETCSTFCSKKPKETIRIRLAMGDFDPLFKSGPSMLIKQLSIKAYPQGEKGYYIIQFDSPIRAKQKNKLANLGVQVFDYLPDFSFIVKMDDMTRAVVESMKNIRWVGIYHPAYKIEPALADALMAGENLLQGEFGELIAVAFKGEDLWEIENQLEQMGCVVLDVTENDFRSKLKIWLELKDLKAVSRINGVKWIERAPVWKFCNDVASGIMDVSGVRNTHNLYGSGQTVAITDTGLDQGSSSPASLHDDFEDGSGYSRVFQIFDLSGDGASDVNSGHGTHVAGSVLGNGDVSGSDPTISDYDNSYAGVAPEATLVFQAAEDNSGSLNGIPLDLNNLFSQTYEAGARIHTNSWGSVAAGQYTSFSEDVDQFMWNNKDFLILFSAGNDGEDADGDGVIDRNSIESPGTAKNCITVGASENLRPDGSTPSPGLNDNWSYPAPPISTDHVSDHASGMAAFSSRGLCLDGRFKPDIVAPGTNIISTKSSLTANTALWGKGGLSTSGPEAQYIFSGGTSMATPLTAGAATLVREFFTNVPIIPSAALIKAILLNGAFDMTPGQYGIESTQEIPDSPRPNNVEGWGRVDLETSIFPAAPKTLRYLDNAIGLETGEGHGYKITVGSGAVPLKVTLVWNDYPGSIVSGGGLVNDLDLILIDPSANSHYPNNANQRGQTELIGYDDGTYSMALASIYPGPGFAVRFTPFAYPVVLDSVRFFIVTDTDAITQFRCNIWNDTGAGGLPGTLLFSQDLTNISLPSGGKFDVEISGVTITAGSFYVELRYTSSSQNNPYLYIDETNPDNRSYVYDGASWSPLPYGLIPNGDWAIQVTVTGSDITTSSDRVNNVVGIDMTSPATGDYLIRVEGYNIPQGPQPYALVITGGNLSPMTEIFLPTAPSNLVVTPVSESEIDLVWDDNSNNEDGFIIERKGPGGTYSQIATVGADVTSYNDTGLSEGTNYYYRVTAYNVGGVSLSSNEASATTSTSPSGDDGDSDDISCFITAVDYGLLVDGDRFLLSFLIAAVIGVSTIITIREIRLKYRGKRHNVVYEAPKDHEKI